MGLIGTAHALIVTKDFSPIRGMVAPTIIGERLFPKKEKNQKQVLELCDAFNETKILRRSTYASSWVCSMFGTSSTDMSTNTSSKVIGCA
jgi:hypothetical protein